MFFRGSSSRLARSSLRVAVRCILTSTRRDPIDREMVRSINEIGHLTGKQTIAEFAENAEIIQMLTSLWADYSAQGTGWRSSADVEVGCCLRGECQPR